MHNFQTLSDRQHSTQTTKWKLVVGSAPTGITTHLLDPGIFPECAKPVDLQPQDLHCDQQEFRNYPGVEVQEITDRELQLH